MTISLYRLQTPPLEREIRTIQQDFKDLIIHITRIVSFNLSKENPLSQSLQERSILVQETCQIIDQILKRAFSKEDSPASLIPEDSLTLIEFFISKHQKKALSSWIHETKWIQMESQPNHLTNAISLLWETHENKKISPHEFLISRGRLYLLKFFKTPLQETALLELFELLRSDPYTTTSAKELLLFIDLYLEIEIDEAFYPHLIKTTTQILECLTLHSKNQTLLVEDPEIMSRTERLFHKIKSIHPAQTSFWMEYATGLKKHPTKSVDWVKNALLIKQQIKECMHPEGSLVAPFKSFNEVKKNPNLLYSFINDLEFVILYSKSPQCQKKALHFLLETYFTKNPVIKERVIEALYTLLNHSNKKIISIASLILRFEGKLISHEPTEFDEHLLYYFLELFFNIPTAHTDSALLPLHLLAYTTDDVKNYLKTLEVIPYFSIHQQDELGNHLYHHLAINNRYKALLLAGKSRLQIDKDASNYEGNTPIHLCLIHHSFKSLRALIELGANPNHVDAKGKTAFHNALNDPTYESLEILCTSKIKPNQVDFYGNTPLDLAIDKGDIKAVEILLQAKGNVSCESPLIQAIRSGHQPVIDYFKNFVLSLTDFEERELEIKKITSRSNKRTSSITDLMNYAVEGSKYAIDTAKTFLRNGGDINATDRFKTTAAHIAICNHNTSFLEMLKKRNSNFNLGNIKGFTPAHAAAHLYQFNSLKILQDGASDFNQKNAFGETPLHILSGKDPQFPPTSLSYSSLIPLELKPHENSDHLETFTYALNLSDPCIQDIKGNTALHRAVLFGTLEIIQLLIEKCPDLFWIPNHEGLLPVELQKDKLHAIFPKNTDPEITKNKISLLVQCHAIEPLKTLFKKSPELAFSQEPQTGYTPLHTAALHGFEEILSLYQPRSYIYQDLKGNTALHLAALKGDLSFIRRYLIFDPNAVFIANNEGRYPIHLSAKNNHKDCTLLFIDHNQMPLKEDSHHELPIHLAARFGQKETFQLLMEHFLKTLSHPNERGETPIHLLSKYGWGEILSTLPKLPTELNRQTHAGLTPLHLAAIYGHENVAQILLNLNADPHILDHLGNTPIDTAVFYLHYPIIEKLLPFTPKKKFNVYQLFQSKPPKNSPNARVEIFTHLSKLKRLSPETDEQRSTNTHLAIQHQDISFLELLMTDFKRQKINFFRKFPINTKNQAGRTPLQEAVIKGYLEGVLFLLKMDVNPFQKDLNGNNLLHLLCDQEYFTSSHIKVFDHLSSHFSNLQLEVNNKNETFSYFLKKRGNTSVENPLSRSSEENLQHIGSSTVFLH
ncbi:ankyrin repeat domain-containing protein [Chlamydiales bacterium]|nr:ankyrin repeat domain-containing protein [Chlamydiales bacterium]